MSGNDASRVCVFCEIRDGRQEASYVYRDETYMVIPDLHPVARGHLLVIPKAHVTSVLQLPIDAATRLFNHAREMARQLMDSELRPEGFNFLLAEGAVAFQEVFHVHLHVIPRYSGDGFEIRAEAWGRPQPDRAELDRVAAIIRAAGSNP